jgi:polyhydroxyalkanoate synthase
MTADAKAWLKGADVHQGTWWTDLGGRVDERCGEQRPAPRGSGRRLTCSRPRHGVFDK